MVLLSATLDMEDDEVAELRDLLKLESPVILALQSLPDSDRLRQFNVSCPEKDDKFLQWVQKFVAGFEIWSFLDIFRIIFGQKI